MSRDRLGWFRRISLRGRLMVIGTTGLAVALLAGSWGFYAALTLAIDRTLDNEAAATAREVATMVAEDRMPEPIPGSGAQVIQVVDGQGRVIGGSLLADRLTPILRPDELARALRGQAISVPGSRAGLAGPLRVTAIAAGRSDDSVIVALPVVEVLAGRRTLRTALLIAVPVLLAALAAIAWRAIGWTLRPVEELRMGAERISGGTEAARLPVPEAADEIRALAETLNGMLDRLAAARERQRTFVADAAHELRSPLASIKTQLDVAERLGEGGELIEDLLVDVTRLAVLVEDLLLLARSDADRRGPAVPETFAVRSLLAEFAARPNRVPVNLRSGPDPQVRADRQELRRAIANLVDNAVRYATDHVELAVDVRAVDVTSPTRSVIISVLDDGPGIATGDRERVFDRFTRLDDARTRDGGGSGLGLAIARELVQRAGGQIELGDGPAGWSLEATIILPSVPAAVDQQVKITERLR